METPLWLKTPTTSRNTAHRKRVLVWDGWVSQTEGNAGFAVRKAA
jgi:hypothetical protein